MTWDLLLLKAWFYGLGYIFWCLVATFVISLIFPRAWKKKYFWPPHYSAGEVMLYGAYPLRMQLVVQLCAITVWPKIGKRRKLDKAYLDAPLWWRRLSYAYVSLCVIPGIVWILAALVLFVRLKLFN